MARLAEHLAAQLEAIAREASARSLREWDSAPPKIARWQRKRIQHQDFERRLREMVAERRARPARVTDPWNSKRCIVKWKPMKRARHAAAMRWKKSKTG